MSGRRPKATEVNATEAREDMAGPQSKRMKHDQERHREGGWPDDSDYPGGSHRPGDGGGPSGDISAGGNFEASRAVAVDKAPKEGKKTDEEEKECNCHCM